MGGGGGGCGRWADWEGVGEGRPEEGEGRKRIGG